MEDLREISKDDLLKVKEIYEDGNKALQFGNIKFWIFCSVLSLIGIFILPEYANKINILFLLSLFMVGKRLGNMEGYFDGYDHGHSDGVDKSLKRFYNLTDEELKSFHE